MNPNKEAGKQNFDHFKKQALLALTTAFRAPLMLMMGCGYINNPNRDYRLYYTDTNGEKRVIDPVTGESRQYNNEPIIDLVEEGEVIPELSDIKLPDGSRPVHGHDSTSTYGPYGVRWE